MSVDPVEPLQPPPSTNNPMRKEPPRGTRAGVIWTFTVGAVLLLILLIIFMVQNQDRVTVYFLGFHGQLALGITLLIAAVGGALVVSIVGAVRIIQLRSRAHSASKSLAKNAKGPL
ncbi:LapA family protein [Paeniglutamicibacter terrestris]|nr:lipopolysaccharide assembly protein LapA domain-containing protein [Paeniglutamicibacter terrestris]